MILLVTIIWTWFLAGDVWAKKPTTEITPAVDFPEWPGQSTARPLSAITISNYLLESETPSIDGRVNYDYVYRLEIINQSQDYYHQVNANLLSQLPDGVQLINSRLNFGVIGPVSGTEYRALSKNTFLFRKNPATPLDLTTLQWQITGEPLGAPPVKRGIVTGVVVDTYCRKLENALVMLRESSVKTDSAGEFSLTFGQNDISANHSLVITSRPEGYTEYQVKIPLNAQPRYDLTMVVKPVAARTAVFAPYKQEIRVNEAYRAEFRLPAAGLIEGDTRLLVSEPVSANLTTLDLSNTERGAFPGNDFLGISHDTPLIPVALEVIVAAEVALIGASGVRYPRLAIPAQLRLAIPGHLLNQVSEGETLPLWYYDTTGGVWRQEGSGVVRRDINDGRLWVESQINHLSWWIAARPLRELSCLRFRPVDEKTNTLLDQVRFTIEGVNFVSGALAIFRGEEGAFTTKRTKDLTNPELVRLMFYERGVPNYLQRDPTHPTRYYKVSMPGLATPFPMANIAMQHTAQWDNCQDLGMITVSARIRQ